MKAKYRAFGTENSVAQMSKLTPIQCELVENHVPPVAKGWYMSTQEENNFLLKKLKELDVMGIVRETKNPVYGSTAFTVPKKGPKNIEWC